MTPVEVCDLMDFWEAAPWPLTCDQAQQLAVDGLGWTIELEDGISYLMNTVSGGRISFHLTQRGLSAMFDTPQDVELDRKAGHR